MINRHLVVAAIVIMAVAAFYAWQFYFKAGYGIIADTSAWGSFGDYFGGLINPILSFLNLTLLIKSLSLQNEANRSLRDQLANNTQSEKLKDLSTLLFNMIESQKKMFDRLTIELSENGVATTIKGVDAAIKLEEELEIMRTNGATNEAIEQFVDTTDASDKIFGILRAFYISIKMIAEKLSDAEGFSITDRRQYYMTLINFTDFSQLRLILIGTQFIKCPASAYLSSAPELLDVLKEVNLDINPY